MAEESKQIELKVSLRERAKLTDEEIEEACEPHRGNWDDMLPAVADAATDKAFPEIATWLDSLSPVEMIMAADRLRKMVET